MAYTAPVSNSSPAQPRVDLVCHVRVVANVHLRLVVGGWQLGELGVDGEGGRWCPMSPCGVRSRRRVSRGGEAVSGCKVQFLCCM